MHDATQLFLVLAGPLPNILTLKDSTPEPSDGVKTNGAVKEDRAVAASPAGPDADDTPDAVTAPWDRVSPNGNRAKQLAQSTPEMMQPANGHLEDNCNAEHAEAAQPSIVEYSSDSEPSLRARSKASDHDSDACSEEVQTNGHVTDSGQQAQLYGHSDHNGNGSVSDGMEVVSQPLKQVKHSYKAQSGYAAQSGYGASDDDDSQLSEAGTDEDAEVDSDAEPEVEVDAQPELQTDAEVTDQLHVATHSNGHVQDPPMDPPMDPPASTADPISIDLPVPPVPMTIIDATKPTDSMVKAGATIVAVATIRPFDVAGTGNTARRETGVEPTAMLTEEQPTGCQSDLPDIGMDDVAIDAQHGRKGSVGQQAELPDQAEPAMRSLEGWKVSTPLHACMEHASKKSA